jgi:NitT/TauT family transport system ATP-binding protein
MLEISGLTKSFADIGGGRDRIRVLDGISFSVPKNQFVCLLGGSGCGKTTLIKIVAGLIEPDAGSIAIEGRTVKGPGFDCSLVFQNYGLLPWRNVLRNVEFGLEIRGLGRERRREICLDYIRRVGLAGFESHYPHQISGGMQQRVGLARALSKDPKILLMDEPFAAVDMQTREKLQDELLSIWWTMKTTVLFVTHSIEEAIYLGDRVIVMGARPGRIAADIATELPRPRADSDVKSSPRYAELQRIVRAALRQTQATQS